MLSTEPMKQEACNIFRCRVQKEDKNTAKIPDKERVLHWMAKPECDLLKGIWIYECAVFNFIEL